MIKRLLLFIAGVLVIVGLVYSNIPIKILLEIVGMLIFLVLGVSLIVPNIGCSGGNAIAMIGVVCVFVAISFAMDLLGVLLVPESPINLCQFIVRDVNNNIVSNLTAPCP